MTARLRLQVVGLALLAASLSAHGGVPAPLSTSALEAMTPIDTLPDPAYLDTVFEHQTLAQLGAIANRTTAADFGVQLRAIRMLVAYCPTTGPCGVGTTTHDTLATILDDYDPLSSGPQDVLRLRAAIESLGIAGRTAGLDADVARLVQFLTHQSRDVRAATAKALRALCNTQAITPLRARLQSEAVDQVKLAISAALRDLGTGQCSH